MLAILKIETDFIIRLYLINIALSRTEDHRNRHILVLPPVRLLAGSGTVAFPVLSFE